MESPDQRLHAGDVNGCAAIEVIAGSDEGMRDIKLRKGFADLIDQLNPMREDHRLLFSLNGAVRDVGEHDRFAAAGWHDQQDAALALAELAANGGDGLILIRPE